MLDSMRLGRKGWLGGDRRFSSLRVRRTWCWAGLGLAVAAVAVGPLLGCGDSEPSSRAAASDEFLPSRESSHASVWAVGDGADGDDESKALARLIASSRPDLFLYLGDVYDKGTAADFAQNYAPVYGALANLTAPTPGNHDWPRHVEGYDPYWERVTGMHPPAYYSFSLAGWQILSLNSEGRHGRRSPQIRWLRGQVRRPGTCRLAFWHRPRYSAGTHHGDQDDVEPFWSALRGRARIAVNGHEHDMQRHEVRDGITEFVSGAGGKSHYEIDFGYPGLAFGNDTDWGALRLDLRPGEARFAFVTDAGVTLDSGTIACRRR